MMAVIAVLFSMAVAIRYPIATPGRLAGGVFGALRGSFGSDGWTNEAGWPKERNLC